MLFENELKLQRCPHCSIAHPNLPTCGSFQTAAGSLPHNSRFPKHWRGYACASCGGVVLALSHDYKTILSLMPSPREADYEIPERPRKYLQDAINSIHTPSGCMMLCASSVDAMLRDKGLKEGTLYVRIKQAAELHLITKEMSEWAHEVRIGANEERHPDDTMPFPSNNEAERAIKFVEALGTFLYVLPAMVVNGRKKGK